MNAPDTEQLKDWFIEGYTACSIESSLRFEKRLELYPSDIESRIKLLGYYEKQRFENKSVAKKRQVLIRWLVDSLPAHSFLASSFGLAFKHEDRKFYNCIKKRWYRYLNQNPEDMQIPANAAFFLWASGELREAIEIASANFKKDPMHSGLRRVRSLILNSESFKRYLKEHAGDLPECISDFSGNS